VAYSSWTDTNLWKAASHCDTSHTTTIVKSTSGFFFAQTTTGTVTLLVVVQLVAVLFFFVLHVLDSPASGFCIHLWRHGRTYDHATFLLVYYCCLSRWTTWTPLETFLVVPSSILRGSTLAHTHVGYNLRLVQHMIIVFSHSFVLLRRLTCWVFKLGWGSFQHSLSCFQNDHWHANLLIS
jgi:hypothetical protein